MKRHLINHIAFSFCLFLLSFAALAQNQELISVSVKNETLLVAMRKIEDSSSYTFFYDSARPELAQKVSFSMKDATIEHILKTMLGKLGVEYQISGKQIVLLSGSQSKTRIVSGVIMDVKGEPVLGAAVFNADKTIAMITDFDGKFEFEAGESPITLEITCLGYKSGSVVVNPGQTKITVILQDDTISLDESVVVGYGSQKKSNLTGALTVVDSKELSNRSALDVGHMLQGVVPGLTVESGSGRPGEAASINIRGVNSINGGNPLVLIDGVEGDLQRVNPTDVESISVVKDAAAAAIYGARASFGVILVTTKSGNSEDGKPTLTYSGRGGFTTPTTCTDYENRGYYSVLINNMFFKAYAGTPYANYTEEDMNELWIRRNDVTEHPDRPWVVVSRRNGKDVYNYYANTDWYHWLYNDVKPTHSHSVSISGGTKAFKYLISGSYNYEQGMFKQNPDKYRKYNLRSKLSADVTKWLNITNNTSFFSSTYSYPGISGVNNAFANMTSHALASYPIANPDGTPIYTTQYCSYQVMNGAVVYLSDPNFTNKDKVNNISNTIEATIKPLKQLEIKGNYTYTFYHSANMNRSVNSAYSGAPGLVTQLTTGKFENKLSEGSSVHEYHAANIYGTYSDTFADAHNLKIMAGFNYETKHLKNVKAIGYNLMSDTLNDLNLVGTDSDDEIRDDISGGQNEYAIAGVFGRINYDYKGRYLFEVSGRYDGTSRFAQKSRWGFFPSASVGWRISEEKFFEPAKQVMGNLKIRYSYGLLGNQQVGYYDYIRSVSIKKQDYLFGGDRPTSASISAPVASNLTWETVCQHNLGIDMGFFNNRLNVTAEAYIRDTKDMLTAGIALPSVYGADSPKMNSADLRTKGWELAVSWKDTFTIGNHPFQYSASFVLSDYVSHITKFDNPDKNFAKKYWEGMRYGDIWGYHIDGLFKTDEEARNYGVDQSIVNSIINQCAGEEKGLRAGDMKFADLNGNGKIDEGANTADDPGDRRIIGNKLPRYSYGINLGLNFFGFDFSVFLQGVGHQDWYPPTEAMSFWSVYNRPYSSLIPKDFLDNCWSEENPDAYFPRPRGYIAMSSNRALGAVNDRYLQNIAYCRLKNLTFGYTLPSNLLEKAKIKNLRVYFTGENLAYLAPGLKSKYIDPEMASTNGQMNIYPWQKIFMFGLDITF